jgi:hypothetical protein
MARTPTQQIADLTAKLARAKKAERAKRTRTLIETGAIFFKAVEILEALPKEQRKNAVRLLATQTEDFASKILKTHAMVEKNEGAEK